MRLQILDLLLPREVKFYNYFNQQVDLLLEGIRIFRTLLYAIDGMPTEEINARIAEIEACEKRGDEIERTIIDALNKTFITPLDREDIHLLAISIDRGLDILNSISRKFNVYNIRKVPDNLCKFAEITVTIAVELETLFDTLKKKGKVEAISAIVNKMHQIENEADDLFIKSMSELFSNQNNVYTPIDVIKFKEFYEHMENIVDAVDYIGKIVRGVTVKMG
ncbi:MAG: DUF47 family protein [Chitinivibrionales bacterium]|nr:DUF47 family protein [Chitinivibrionales bacterium]